jgi:hypothetical protein
MADKVTNTEKLPRGYQRKRCSSCHRVRPCAFVSDPFADEVRGDKTRYWLCDDCVFESKQGI